MFYVDVFELLVYVFYQNIMLIIVKKAVAARCGHTSSVEVSFCTHMS